MENILTTTLLPAPLKCGSEFGKWQFQVITGIRIEVKEHVMTRKGKKMFALILHHKFASLSACHTQLRKNETEVKKNVLGEYYSL
jgi:hypothetical protein